MMSDLSKLDSAKWSSFDPDAKSNSQVRKVLKSIAEFATVSEILRTCGAMIIVASMSLFLIQGLTVAADVQRYGMLLLQTLLLTSGGFALSYLLKENKGARIFYGLSLISIPANFTVLGALGYSITGQPTPTLPSFASWIVTDVSALIVTGVIAAAVLVPLTWFCLRIFARGHEAKLSVGLLASCSTVLIPTREPLFIGLVAVVGVLTLFGILKSIRKQSSEPATAPSWFIRGVLFTPILILVVRNAGLYEFDALVALTLATTAFLIARQTAISLPAASLMRKCLEFVCAPFAVAMGIAVFELLQPYGQESAVALISIAIAAELIFDIAFRAGTSSMSRTLTSLSMMFVAATLIELTLFSTEIGIVAGSTALLAMGTFLMIRKQRSAESIIGGVAISIILAPHFFKLIEAIDLGNWVVLSIVGAVAVVGGSVLDRHGASIKLRIENWFYQSRSADGS